jgi:hypothetical protein
LSCQPAAREFRSGYLTAAIDARPCPASTLKSASTKRSLTAGNPGFIGKKVTNIVIDYLRSHPETQHETAASEINAALKRFNCDDSNSSSLSISR